ncbi:glycosyltransferase [Sandaracinobacteroides hominis]|uniref:glycosyltransferase n=1 Tax=Sandaracinobacteroides hominis TaxID=2780086 RepID=UPI0018F36D95|nr:glycosyltransferase [Sandaracinobacteroides hominis]
MPRLRGGDDVLREDPGLPRVSVIIPHFNTPELLVKCLQAVASQALDHGWFEIIVVDNGSRMPMRLIEAAWPGVRFLLQREPGPGPARNMGVAHARADVLAFVDADVRVAPGWLQAGLKAVGDQELALVGGDVRIDVGDRKRMTDVEAFESVFSFRQKAYIKKKHYSVTANIIMTRAVFDRAGPFDGINMPEDRAFGERAYAMGIKTRYAPRMLAFHPARRDFEEMRSKWTRLSQQAFSAQMEKGRPILLWKLRAAAVAASGLVHAPQMLVSRRVSGLGNRFRGLGFLLKLRWLRALDMLEIASKARAGEQLIVNWNK